MKTQLHVFTYMYYVQIDTYLGIVSHTFLSRINNFFITISPLQNIWKACKNDINKLPLSVDESIPKLDQTFVFSSET